MKKRRSSVILLCIAVLLTACKSSGSGTEYALSSTEYGRPLVEKEVEISYEVPRALPNVLVDRLGYEPKDDKGVIFRGEKLPEHFSICETDSRRVVYTGRVEQKSSQQEETLACGYGDFSDFTTPGSYYVQIDTYGESYPFMIHENLYYTLFKRSAGQLYGLRSKTINGSEGWQLQQKGSQKEISACLCIYQLLFSYELFPEVHTDDTGIPESGNEIPDILDECRYEIQWLIQQAQISPDGSGVACGYRAAVLAKYAYLTKQLDAGFAGDCLREAENAWKTAGRDSSVPKELIALSAAELYRATGNRQYLGVAESHLQSCGEKKGKLTELEFFGTVTYMNTKNKVNVELCDTLIRKLMDEAEEIAALSKKNRFLVHSDKEMADGGALLQEMLRICVVNHVITNHEYNIVIENHFHYLMGRNPKALCYVSYWDGQEMETEDLLEDPVKNSALLFILSELLSNQT